MTLVEKAQTFRSQIFSLNASVSSVCTCLLQGKPPTHLTHDDFSTVLKGRRSPTYVVEYKSVDLLLGSKAEIDSGGGTLEVLARGLRDLGSRNLSKYLATVARGRNVEQNRDRGGLVLSLCLGQDSLVPQWDVSWLNKHDIHEQQLKSEQ